jgi:hypothetical protein
MHKQRHRVRFSALGALSAALASFAFLPGCERATAEELASVSGSIIGGQPDATHKGVVSLLKQVQQNGYYPACTGTLIAPNLVLTAHHCVAALSSGDAESVECGKTVFQAPDAARTILISVEQNAWTQDQQPYRVSEVWLPEGNSDVCGRDVALLLLSGSGIPANVAPTIAPRLETPLQKNEAFIAVGYGLQDPKDETGETSGQRMVSTDARVYCEGDSCGSPMVTDSEFIAESPVCSGDSGGPALDKDGLVSGVTSRGDADCTIGIYSDVAAWKDFIIEKALLAAKSGGYSPPAWTGADPVVDPGTDPTDPTPTDPDPTDPTPTDPTPTDPVPTNPLGMSCNGPCASGYQCWAESGTPPGICVPSCSAASPTCPSGYGCDTSLQVCTPATTSTPGGAGTSGSSNPDSATQSSSSCAVSAPHGGESGFALGLALLGFGFSRRRARSK